MTRQRPGADGYSTARLRLRLRSPRSMRRAGEAGLARAGLLSCSVSASPSPAARGPAAATAPAATAASAGAASRYTCSLDSLDSLQGARSYESPRTDSRVGGAPAHSLLWLSVAVVVVGVVPLVLLLLVPLFGPVVWEKTTRFTYASASMRGRSSPRIRCDTLYTNCNICDYCSLSFLRTECNDNSPYKSIARLQSINILSTR